MNFRHEWKHSISYGDFLALRHRLGAVMQRDSHASADGTYQIRSLYFDTPGDKALREKIDGVNAREKFRIRIYNGDDSLIRLEKKSRRNTLGSKESVCLSREEAQRIAAGDTDWMSSHGEELVRELHSKMHYQQLRPKTIVDYRREPFVYAPGNVRITLDWDLRTGLYCTDFLDARCVTLPVPESMYLLEVKYDNFLPDIIRDLVQLPDRRATAFSKYAQCRVYG